MRASMRSTPSVYTTSYSELMAFSFHPLLFALVLLLFSSLTQANVPISKAFSFLIDGYLVGGYLEDSQVYYADVGISNGPFHLCIYGFNPKSDGKFTQLTLALRLDKRLVWEANKGKPVHVNGRVVFNQTGNLALVEANGYIVWETNTASMDVVDLKLLSSGNMVLVDQKGTYVWQSFHHPTDTILVGQSLRSGDRNKLVSHLSPLDYRNGLYSMVIDGGRLILYYRSKLTAKQEIYSLSAPITIPHDYSPYARMTLQSGLMGGERYIYYLKFNFTSVDKTTYSVIPAGLQLKFNTVYSLLRLSHDGNLRMYTYFNQVRDPLMTDQWEETYTMFSHRLYHESECQLPEKCGKFGVCEDNQCVACPTPNGLAGWSDKCAPPKLPSCNNQSGIKIDYYRINGVDHFSSNFSGSGPMKFGKCKENCTIDCQCAGFFYRKDTSKCLITHHLNTLTRVPQSNHLAFIKVVK